MSGGPAARSVCFEVLGTPRQPRAPVHHLLPAKWTGLRVLRRVFVDVSGLERNSGTRNASHFHTASVGCARSCCALHTLVCTSTLLHPARPPPPAVAGSPPAAAPTPTACSSTRSWTRTAPRARRPARAPPPRPLCPPRPLPPARERACSRPERLHKTMSGRSRREHFCCALAWAGLSFSAHSARNMRSLALAAAMCAWELRAKRGGITKRSALIPPAVGCSAPWWRRRAGYAGCLTSRLARYRRVLGPLTHPLRLARSTCSHRPPFGRPPALSATAEQAPNARQLTASWLGPAVEGRAVRCAFEQFAHCRSAVVVLAPLQWCRSLPPATQRRPAFAAGNLVRSRSVLACVSAAADCPLAALPRPAPPCRVRSIRPQLVACWRGVSFVLQQPDRHRLSTATP